MNPVLQRETALAQANRVRLGRAAFRQSVTEKDAEEGLAMVRGAVVNPPSELSSMRVERLLMAVNSIGSHKARNFLRRAHVSPTRRLGDLTDHERLRLDLVLGVR